MGCFRIYNRTNTKIFVFISKWSNSQGDDEWYPLEVGSYADWIRKGWELVAVKFYDNDRSGIYTTPTTLSIYGKNDIR
jgi:hypothetical protein